MELDSVARNFESTNVARIMFLLVSSNHCVLTVKANIVLVQDPRSLECLTSGPQGMGRWCYFSQHTEQPSPEGQPPLRPCTGSQLLGQSPETLPPTLFSYTPRPYPPPPLQEHSVSPITSTGFFSAFLKDLEEPLDSVTFSSPGLPAQNESLWPKTQESKATCLKGGE